MKLLFVLICCFILSTSFAQTDSLTIPPFIYMERHLSVITGYHGFKHHYGEIGFAIHDNGVVSHHPIATTFGLSTEILLNNDESIVGNKLSLWLSGGQTMGFNLIHYSNFSGSNHLAFRPEWGIGFDIFRVYYGYNFKLINDRISQIPSHNFGVNVLINVKHLKTISRTPVYIDE